MHLLPSDLYKLSSGGRDCGNFSEYDLKRKAPDYFKDSELPPDVSKDRSPISENADQPNSEPSNLPTFEKGNIIDVDDAEKEIDLPHPSVARDPVELIKAVLETLKGEQVTLKGVSAEIQPDGTSILKVDDIVMNSES